MYWSFKLNSHLLIERILEELGLIGLVSSYKGFTKIKFDLLRFSRLLIYGQILNPGSHFATIKQNNDYYNRIVKSLSL